MSIISVLVIISVLHCADKAMGSAIMPPMRKMITADQELESDRVKRSVAMMPPMHMAMGDQEDDSVRAERSADMPPMNMVAPAADAASETAIRVKRQCGCGCGCCGCDGGSGGGSGGSGERRRRRRRRRHRERAHRVAVSHAILGNSTYEPASNGSSSYSILHDPPSTPLPWIYEFVTNSSVILPNGEEIESSEIIIIAPESGSGSGSGSGESESPSASYEDSESSEGLMMPYVGTYGSRRAAPGAPCQKSSDCVMGAVCKQVSGIGHCVCEPPMVNLGNGCVPRSGAIAP